MNFSLALTNIVLGASLALAQNTDPADLVRNRLQMNLDLNGMGADLDRERHLGDLNTDFSSFVGEWYNCLSTTATIFDGEIDSADIVDQVECDGGLLGEVTTVGEGDQTLSFEIILLNECSLHDLGGEDQDPCPDDSLDSDPQGDGYVLVKHSFTGIGSFANADRIEFHADHTFLKNGNDVWVPNLDRAKLENIDTLVCQTYLEGIVCDWRINEYRTSVTGNTKGCLKKGVCKDNLKKKSKCEEKNGEWTTTCASTEVIEDGLVYDSFGSYYLVQDVELCSVCESDSSDSEELEPVTGCYKGGACEGANGCCDCSITEEECAQDNGIWTPGCETICL
jgi:hypothetical protein